MKITAFLLSLLLWSVPLSAQMHVTVEPDRIRFGSEFVARRLDLPNVLQVKSGQSVNLPSSDSTFDYVEVAGSLQSSGVLRVTHLVILPGGTLTVTGGEIVIRDVPIDLTKDPHQWGNGLVNFGRLVVNGKAKRAWTSATEDLAAGTTTLTVENADGWQVGDDLLFPDMEELLSGDTYRRESPVTVAALSGTTITLSKPLDFAHSSVRLPDGAVVKTPYVANLTRSVVIRSENPTGTRGHTASIGHEASWDVRYGAFLDLGRTRLEPLHPETNRLGKYPAHNHHANGANNRYEGNVLQRGPKWGLVTHGTSDSLVAWNIGVDFPGGSFVTEDGNEYRNVFDRNFAAYSAGVMNNPEMCIEQNNAGCEGAGFWFRGIGQTITGNVAINNQLGINLMNARLAAGNNTVAKIVQMADNVTIANRHAGLDLWGILRTAPSIERHLSAHNASNIAIKVTTIPINQPRLREVTLVGQHGTSTGVSSDRTYIHFAEVIGGAISGHRVGVSNGGAGDLTIRGVTMQNQLNLDLGSLPERALIENVIHKPYRDFPPQYIVFGRREIWMPGVVATGFPLAEGFGPSTAPRTDHLYRVVGHQGIAGNDFLLFERRQLRSSPMWPNLAPPDVCGTTQGESWDRCGLAYRGSVIADDEVAPFEGLINGIARQGLTQTPLGPPRVILVDPIGTKAVSSPSILFLLTGDATGLRDALRVEIDGKAQTLQRSHSWAGFHGLSATMSEGLHTVRTWRVGEDGKPLANSAMTFTYCVPGPCEDAALSPAPAPPTPEDCVSCLPSR